MPKVEEIGGARVLIVWEGRKVSVRGNCPPHVVVLMTDMAHRLALEKLASGAAGAQDIAKILRGES